MRHILLSAWLIALGTSQAFAQQEAVQPPLAPPAASKPTQTEWTRREIQQRVKASRQEQYDKMPYLEKRVIQEIVTPEEVRRKLEFTSSSAQKELEDVIKRAIVSHTPAKVAWEKMCLARRKILVALRGLFPEASVEFHKKRGQLTSEMYNSNNYRVNLRQPIFHGGALWNGLLQEKAALDAAEYDYDAIVGDLIRDVNKAYYEYHRAEQVVSDRAKAVETGKPFAEISKKKFESQLISEIEHLNTQSLYGQIQYDYETSKQELELAKLELQKFMNLDRKDVFEIKPIYRMEEFFSKKGNEDGNYDLEDLGFLDVTEESAAMQLEKLVDTAYEHRPELRRQASHLESSRLSQKVQWAKMMPSLDVILEFGKLAEAFDIASMDPGYRSEFRLGLELNWNAAGNKVGYTFENDERAPSVTQFQQGTGSQTTHNGLEIGILDGLNDLVAVKEAEIDKLEKVVELEDAEKEVVQSVKQAYFDYEKAKIQVQSTLQRAHYRKRLLDLSQHRLEKNEIQISEYMQAEIDFIEELTKLHKALADFFTARSALNHAVGVPHYLKFGVKHEPGRK